MNECVRCGAPASHKFCRRACAAAWAREHETRLCSVEGCAATLRAKGLCATHYNQTRGADRHKPVTKPCAFCGRPCTRSGGGGRVHGQVCSDLCRSALAFPSMSLPRNHPAVTFFDVMHVGYSECDQCAGPVAHDARHRAPAKCPTCRRKPRFVGCSCVECGSQFTVDASVGGWQADLYCSMRCNRRVNKRRRRARERGRENHWRWPEFVGVWLKFDRCCAYCEQHIDGQPDPDHVVPLSRGGDDVLGNLLPACRACNADKNDLTLDEWQADRSRRGRPARRYSWMPTDARFSHLVPQTVTGEAWRNRVA
jgi:hypothetical protein